MDLEFNKNEDINKLRLAEINQLYTKIKKGGGEKALQKQRDQGKLTARERISYLLDDDNDAIEIAAFAGNEMYEEHGGCPSGGVIVKIGKISGKQCIVVANDATVKAGAWFPITGKKSKSSRNRDGKQTSNYLFGRFCGGLSSYARRNFSRQRTFW
jgi:acetyl-CoA carboxylase carboxyltransferase component